MCATTERGKYNGLVCLGFLALATGITGIILGSVALGKHEDSQDANNKYCFSVRDRNNLDTVTQVVGSVELDIIKDRACVDIIYYQDCGNLTSLEIRGPVDASTGYAYSDNVIASLFPLANGLSTDATSGAIKRCVHVTPKNQHKFLLNPARSYIVANFTGCTAPTNVYQQHFTALCVDSSFVMDEVDDDDDYSSSDSEPVDDVMETSGDSSSSSELLRRAKTHTRAGPTHATQKGHGAAHRGHH